MSEKKIALSISRIDKLIVIVFIIFSFVGLILMLFKNIVMLTIGFLLLIIFFGIAIMHIFDTPKNVILDREGTRVVVFFKDMQKKWSELKRIEIRQFKDRGDKKDICLIFNSKVDLRSLHKATNRVGNIFFAYTEENVNALLEYLPDKFKSQFEEECKKFQINK